MQLTNYKIQKKQQLSVRTQRLALDYSSELLSTEDPALWMADSLLNDKQQIRCLVTEAVDAKNVHKS